MKEHEFQFEKEWASAFAHAEVAPPSTVWNRIETSLDKKDSGRIRRKYLVWQMVAAVSLVIAASVMVYDFVGNKSIPTQEFIANESGIEKNKSESEQAVLPTESEEPRTSNKSSSLAASEISKEENSNEVTISSTGSTRENRALAINEANTPAEVASNLEKEVNLSQLDPIGALNFRKIWLPNPDIHKVRLPLIIVAEQETRGGVGSFWAGINVAGGASNTDNTSLVPLMADTREATITPTSLNTSQVQNSSKTGFGYALGFAVGKNIGKRFYIQSGLQYLVQNIEGSTNAYFKNLTNQREEPIFAFNADKASYSESGNQIRQVEYYSQPISITSSIEYFSIPFQLGYMLIDRKIGWGISTGISSDFFLRNVISDRSGEIDSYVTKNSDPESPFRPVNLSAIFSTEINYNITNNYSVSLEPRFSTGLLPITKDDEEVEERRLKSLSLGVKMRYMF